MRAKPLNVRAPRRPNFIAAAARSGPMFFWRPLPVSTALGAFKETPENEKENQKINIVIKSGHEEW